jgi:hypothetical protein
LRKPSWVQVPNKHNAEDVGFFLVLFCLYEMDVAVLVLPLSVILLLSSVTCLHHEVPVTIVLSSSVFQVLVRAACSLFYIYKMDLGTLVLSLSVMLLLSSVTCLHHSVSVTIVLSSSVFQVLVCAACLQLVDTTQTVHSSKLGTLARGDQ